MLHLTRQVRFAINDRADDQLLRAPTNSFGGYPSLTGLGYFFAIDVAVVGAVDPVTQCLINIKRIDEVIRQRAMHVFGEAIANKTFRDGAIFLRSLLHDVQQWLSPIEVESLQLHLTPTMSISCLAKENPMIRLSQKFEFSASHRLHNPSLSDAENRAAFGKCNNPHGHGHNYEVQVTIAGEPDDNGLLIDVPAFEKIVSDTVIAKLDHKHLNTEVSQFRETIPTVENIARIVYEMLHPAIKLTTAKLREVTVWETPKTWAIYSID